MAIASDNKFPKLYLTTQASTPAAPSGGDWKTFAKADGIYAMGSNGTPVGPFAAASSGSSFVGARAFMSTTQSISTATDTPVTFDSEEYDTNTLHDTGSNTSRFTANATGYWRVTALISLPNSAVQWQVWLRVGGSTKKEPSVRFFGNASGSVNAVLSQVLNLTSAQYVEVLVRQASGGSLSIGSATANNQCYAEFEFVGS